MLPYHHHTNQQYKTADDATLSPSLEHQYKTAANATISPSLEPTV
jgi:hypothetical protein